MQKIFGLLLLVNFALAFNTEYDFFFNTTFLCRHPELKRWFYSMQYFDEDVAPFNGDDPITKKVTRYALPGMVQELSQGTLSGDEAFSSYFDINLVVTHSCNPSNKVSNAKFHLRPLFPIPDGIHSKVSYKHMAGIDVTDKRGSNNNFGRLVHSVHS